MADHNIAIFQHLLKRLEERMMYLNILPMFQTSFASSLLKGTSAVKGRGSPFQKRYWKALGSRISLRTYDEEF
jgi:hypothetical protein